jgi:hypothetical protein
MTYQRYKSETTLPKDEKVRLIADYVEHYERLIAEDGLGALNVKIPREVFDEILDQVGTLLNERAIECSTAGPVKDFLDANPLPPHMQELLPDDFRAFALLLNAVKQWVVAESAATDRYLLGGTARNTCRAAVSTCIVTRGDLGEDAELHHPLRDGRPPILLSRTGHETVERFQQNGLAGVGVPDDPNWLRMCELKKERRMSWVQLREGCGAVIAGVSAKRAGAKSFANTVTRETGRTAAEVLVMLDERGLGL